MKTLLSRFLVFAFVLAGFVVGGIIWNYFQFEKKTKAAPVHSLSVIMQQRSNMIAKADDKKAAPSPRRTIPLVPSPMDHPSEEELRDFPGAQVVEAAEIDGPEKGQTMRLRILKTSFKYPMIRTEEVIDAASNSVVTRAEMVASHLLLALPVKENPELFLKKLGPQAVSIERVMSDASIYRVNLASSSLETLPAGLNAINEVGGGVGEPDFIKHAQLTPNNPRYNKQWEFWENHIGITDNNWFWSSWLGTASESKKISKSYSGINIEKAWDIRTDASSVIVAVVDTGIRYTHQSLVANMWWNPNPTSACDIHGWNGYNNNGDPMDGFGHGTFCAGLIGGVGNSGVGISGVAWKVQLMACKDSSDEGIGTISDTLTCINYAVKHGASIINYSAGGGFWSVIEYMVLKRARDKGVIVVCAAGNNDGDNDTFPFYPANFKLDNIVSVGALSKTGTLSFYSNYGPTTVHLIAPGDDIYSSWGGPPNPDLTSIDGSGDSCYATASGTSSSAPLVTGTLALLKAQFPNESHQELIARLLNATDKISSLKESCITGGCLNVANALTGPTPTNFYIPSPETCEQWITSVLFGSVSGNFGIFSSTGAFPDK